VYGTKLHPQERLFERMNHNARASRDMQTNETAYVDYLETKYRPGRKFYLEHLIYPRYLAEFTPGRIYDVGCGFGAFLEFCRRRNVPATGFDSNPALVKRCEGRGLVAVLANIVSLDADYPLTANMICDNVLEHLTTDEIDLFFSSVKRLLAPDGVLLVIVPNRRGYDSDPTHKTYVGDDLIRRMTRKHRLKLRRRFFHPLPWEFVGTYYIFNMTVFCIENQRDNLVKADDERAVCSCRPL